VRKNRNERCEILHLTTGSSPTARVLPRESIESQTPFENWFDDSLARVKVVGDDEMKAKILIVFLLLTMLPVSTVACGGGGGGEQATTPTDERQACLDDWSTISHEVRRYFLDWSVMLDEEGRLPTADGAPGDIDWYAQDFGGEPFVNYISTEGVIPKSDAACDWYVDANFIPYAADSRCPCDDI